MVSRFTPVYCRFSAVECRGFREHYTASTRGPAQADSICQQASHRPQTPPPVLPPGKRCRWQSCRAFNCRILYGRYLPIVRLIIIGIPSPTHSFIPDLKPSFSANPTHRSPSFSSSKLTTWIPHCLLLLLSISVCTF